jgi:hypothetical protein
VTTLDNFQAKVGIINDDNRSFVFGGRDTSRDKFLRRDKSLEKVLPELLRKRSQCRIARQGISESILLARAEMELEVKFREDIGPSSMTRSQLATLSEIK